MWSRRHPRDMMENSGYSIFVKNLHPAVSERQLRSIFSTVGTIVDCNVPSYKNGTCKGYGFIRFDTEVAARKAVEQINGTVVYDKKMKVSRYLPMEERERALEERAKMFRNIYVENFGAELTEQQFRAMFSKFGKIASLKYASDEYNLPRGYGFVAYEKHDSAVRAIENMNGKEISGGRVLRVKKAQNRSERQKERRNQYQDCNVYVRNLDRDITEDHLYNEFSQFGAITSARIMTEEGRSKGFGFICFSTAEEAAAAVRGMHNNSVWTRPLYVALAQDKEERRAQLTTDYMQRMANLRMRQSHRLVPLGTSGGYPIPANVNPSGIEVSTEVRPIENISFLRPVIAHQVLEPLELQLAGQNPPTLSGYRLPNSAPSTSGHVVGMVPLAFGQPQYEKEVLRKRLFRFVLATHSDVDLAMKVAELLIELDDGSLTTIMENDVLLRDKVEEGIVILQMRQAKQVLDKLGVD